LPPTILFVKNFFTVGGEFAGMVRDRRKVPANWHGSGELGVEGNAEAAK
jgi:hypothetical protein